MNIAELNKKITLSWVEAFNEHDLEKLLSLYAADAIHFSPKLKIREPQTNGWISGKPALRAWWADAFQRLPLLKYELQNLIVNETQVMMEYLRTSPGDADMMIAEILEIKDGLIIKSRVYHS